jgi:hypothetical protein
MDIEKTDKAIVDSAIKVHKALGLGLLESVYKKYLKAKLNNISLRPLRLCSSFSFFGPMLGH